MSDEKPPILQDQEFTVEEGFGYRALRTGAIWMNKLFFSSLALLAIWLLAAFAGDIQDCTTAPQLVEGDNGTVDEGERLQCSPFLTTTAKYLGAMTLLSFGLSVGFGLLGLVVGKRIVESTPAQEEVGADRSGGDASEPEAPDGQNPDPGASRDGEESGHGRGGD